MRRRALRFRDETGLQEMLELLDEFADRGPVEYELLPDAPIVVLPQWMYDQLLPVLIRQGIGYTEMKVRPFSDLPQAKQAELRGMIWSKRE